MTENEANMSIQYAVCVLEAIGNGLTLSNENDREEACAFAIQALEEIQQYRAIGTVEECRNAVERMKPKKKVIEMVESVKCANCGSGCINEYCSKCGQAIDWSK